MKIKADKEIKIDYTAEECDKLDEIATFITTLIHAMQEEECDTIYGDNYDDEIYVNISIDDLQQALTTIKNIKYTTEMF